MFCFAVFQVDEQDMHINMKNKSSWVPVETHVKKNENTKNQKQEVTLSILKMVNKMWYRMNEYPKYYPPQFPRLTSVVQAKNYETYNRGEGFNPDEYLA